MNKVDYMSENDRVRSLVQRFVQLPVTELKRHQTGNKMLMDYLCNDIEETADFSKEAVLQMDYLDLACMVTMIPEYILKDAESEKIRLIQYRALADYLLGAEMSCIPIRLFLGLSVKEFYDCLESVRCDKKLHHELEQLCKEYPKIKEDMMLRDVLDMCNKELRNPWTPLAEIGEYRRNILRNYYLLGRILVHSFRHTFPERFRMDYMYSKNTNNR